MKKHIFLIVAGYLLSTAAFAAPINFNFTNIGLGPGSTSYYSTAGDFWRATNVATIDGVNLYADLRIIETSLASPGATDNSDVSNRIFFVSNAQEAQKGDRVRMRFDNRVTGVGAPTDDVAPFPLWAKVEVAFFNSTTDTPFEFLAGDSLLTQFDDLDSDLNQNYSDFGGIRTGDFTNAFLPVNPSNLEIDTTTVPDFTIGILKQPWGPQENETSTDPLLQAPYTIAFNTFLSDGAFSFQFVMGTDGTGNPNRHIDMDMTGVLIPEPGTIALMVIALGGACGVSLLRRRKRK